MKKVLLVGISLLLVFLVSCGNENETEITNDVIGIFLTNTPQKLGNFSSTLTSKPNKTNYIVGWQYGNSVLFYNYSNGVIQTVNNATVPLVDFGGYGYVSSANGLVINGLSYGNYSVPFSIGERTISFKTSSGIKIIKSDNTSKDIAVISPEQVKSHNTLDVVRSGTNQLQIYYNVFDGFDTIINDCIHGFDLASDETLVYWNLFNVVHYKYRWYTSVTIPLRVKEAKLSELFIAAKNNYNQLVIIGTTSYNPVIVAENVIDFDALGYWYIYCTPTQLVHVNTQTLTEKRWDIPNISSVRHGKYGVFYSVGNEVYGISTP